MKLLLTLLLISLLAFGSHAVACDGQAEEDCACPVNCASCTDASTCTSCNAQYGLVNDACSPCSAGYYSADGNTDVCTQCPIGTGIYSCSDASTALSCQSGYYLSGNSCQACTSGTYTSDDNDDPSCTSCPNEMATCTDGPTAITCKANYYFNIGSCWACSAGTYTAPSTASPSCSACTSPCATCNGSTSTCTACAANYYLSGNSCLQCSTGTYTDARNTAASCTACASTCTACSSSGCSSCVANTYLSSGSCHSCPSGYYNAPGSSSSCTGCPTGTATCNYTSGSVTAYTCSANYYLSGSKCLSCPSGTYSTSGNSAAACTTCPGICASCSSSDTCTSCHANYGLANGDCTACGSGFKSSEGNTGACTLDWCPENYYKNGGTCTPCAAGTYASKGSTKCSTCIDGCTSCNNTSTCITCGSGFTWTEGVCTTTPNTTDALAHVTVPFTIRYDIPLATFNEQKGLYAFVTRVAYILGISSATIIIENVYEGSTIIEGQIMSSSTDYNELTNAKEIAQNFENHAKAGDLSILGGVQVLSYSTSIDVNNSTTPQTLMGLFIGLGVGGGLFIPAMGYLVWSRRKQRRSLSLPQTKKSEIQDWVKPEVKASLKSQKTTLQRAKTKMSKDKPFVEQPSNLKEDEVMDKTDRKLLHVSGILDGDKSMVGNESMRKLDVSSVVVSVNLEADKHAIDKHMELTQASESRDVSFARNEESKKVKKDMIKIQYAESLGDISLADEYVGHVHRSTGDGLSNNGIASHAIVSNEMLKFPAPKSKSQLD